MESDGKNRVKWVFAIAAVAKYIATQDEHHRKRSFQEEFVVFLKKDKVAYDERYIWD